MFPHMQTCGHAKKIKTLRIYIPSFHFATKLQLKTLIHTYSIDCVSAVRMPNFLGFTVEIKNRISDKKIWHSYLELRN